MKLTPNSFFDFSDEFKYLDLNSFYLKYRNEMSDPRKPQLIQWALAKRDLDALVYGGYSEDRKDVWANTYMKETGKFVHLGVDIIMPYETPVFVPFDARLVDIFRDKDEKIGWGGRVILEKNKKHLVLGHRTFTCSGN